MSKPGTYEQCPGCVGVGQCSAMSGYHLPHTYMWCSDCKGYGRVTSEQAEHIRDRHRRYRENAARYDSR